MGVHGGLLARPPGDQARCHGAGSPVVTAVSYTHLDVYKRQGLRRWDGRSEQVPAAGHAVLFERSIAAVIPDDLDPRLSLMVMDVCGAPALVSRVVGEYACLLYTSRCV